MGFGNIHLVCTLIFQENLHFLLPDKHTYVCIIVMVCAIWYHLYNFKNVKNTHLVVLLLGKLHAEACNFTKSNTPQWVFYTFFKLYKLYQIAQSVSYMGGEVRNISFSKNFACVLNE